MLEHFKKEIKSIEIQTLNIPNEYYLLFTGLNQNPRECWGVIDVKYNRIKLFNFLFILI